MVSTSTHGCAENLQRKQTISRSSRSIAVLVRLFKRTQIRTVCTEMWDAYVTAVREVLPHAAIVIDRVHVAKHYRDGANTLRKQEFKRLRAALPHETMDPLKHTMWPFRKRPADLDADEQDRLTRLFEHALQLKQAYDLREQLTAIFDTARAKAEGPNLAMISFTPVRR
jgi:transposase